MHETRTSAAILLLAAFAAAALWEGRADAKPGRFREPTTVVSLERILLPDVIADRIEGSGIECRSFAMRGGAHHSVQVGSVRLNLTSRLALRGGLGMARYAALPLDAEQSGLAASAGVTFTLWRRVGYSVDVDVAALRATYDGAAMLDGSFMVGFRRR